MQLLVLAWAQNILQLNLSQAAYLQASTAIGVIIGAMSAGRWVKLQHATAVLGVGVAMGLVLPLMVLITQWSAALGLTLVMGGLGGGFSGTNECTPAIARGTVAECWTFYFCAKYLREFKYFVDARSLQLFDFHRLQSFSGCDRNGQLRGHWHVAVDLSIAQVQSQRNPIGYLNIKAIASMPLPF